MSWENAGYGAGGGIVTAILVAIGFKARLDNLEKRVVYKDSCEKCSLNTDNQIKAVHESQLRVEGKLDKLLINLSRRRGDQAE